jgi:hypothetical protein
LLESIANAVTVPITPEVIDRLVSALRKALKSDDPGFRKAYLRLFVDQLPTANAVPSFVRDWRALVDSNHRPTA